MDKQAFEMTTGDLIMCVNLLHEDAREWERLEAEGKEKGPAARRAEDRRKLAWRMKHEVERRAAERMTQDA